MHEQPQGARGSVPYRLCESCVMDTSDPLISFDSRGHCTYCLAYERRARHEVATDATGRSELERRAAEIREQGAGLRFDCIIGLSGGVDSTYVAWLAHELNLRPLAVHLDNGWNTATSVQNIYRAITTLDIPLRTWVLDWDEFRRLQLAFLRASTPDSEIPTDHAIWAALVRTAREVGSRYVLGGSNFATESVLPASWGLGIKDWRYIREVHHQFDDRPLCSFPHLTLSSVVRDALVRRIKIVHPLNLLRYDKASAVKTLEDELGWEPYGGKHHESIYTRFFQCYILPRKFGIDKRRAHLASLVLADQMTREEALQELGLPPCAPDVAADDQKYVLKKLGISAAEFDEIMSAPVRTFHHYPSYESHWAGRAAFRAYRSRQSVRAVFKAIRSRGKR